MASLQLLSISVKNLKHPSQHNAQYWLIEIRMSAAESCQSHD